MISEEGGNTILYKGVQYSLLSAQITLPSHAGYASTTTVPVLELSLTFHGSQVLSSYPSVILFIIPIFVGSGDVRAGYLQQLLASDATSSTAVSLESLFTPDMTSFGYKTCIDLASGTQSSDPSTSMNLYVLYFPQGISMSQQEVVTLATLVAPQGGQVPPFGLPGSLLNGLSTVSAYTVDSDGTTVPTTVSDTGAVGTQSMSSSMDEFVNTVQYFGKPPAVSSSSDTSCPAFTTSQYKCLPFNKFYDISGTLNDPSGGWVMMKDAMASSQGSSVGLFGAGSGSDTDTPAFGWSVLLDILIVVAAIGLVALVIYFVWGGGPVRNAGIRAASAAVASVAVAAGTPKPST